jgi:hypothetical protein
MKNITLHEAKNIALGAMHMAEKRREDERIVEAKYWQSLESAKQSVQLTALRRGLAASIFINVILLAVVAFTIGGN